jgi:hypothetical protein
MKFVLGLAVSAAVWTAAGGIAQAADTAPVPAAPEAALQEAAAAPSVVTAPPATPTTAGFTAPGGSIVDLEIVEEVNSKTNIRGDKIAVRLARPIMAGDHLLVPAGTMGMAEVIDARPAGLMGKNGVLLLAARYLDYQGQRIPLKALKLGGGGKDNSSTVMAVSMAVGLPAVLIRGGNMDIPVGAPANAKLAADLTLPDVPDTTAAPGQPSTTTAVIQEEKPQ